MADKQKSNKDLEREKRKELTVRLMKEKEDYIKLPPEKRWAIDSNNRDSFEKLVSTLVRKELDVKFLREQLCSDLIREKDELGNLKTKNQLELDLALSIIFIAKIKEQMQKVVHDLDVEKVLAELKRYHSESDKVFEEKFRGAVNEYWGFRTAGKNNPAPEPKQA